METLLARLEQYDTYEAAHALRAAMSFDAGDEQLTQSSWRLLEEVLDDATFERMVAWAEERLNNWHSLKVNALDACWAADPTGENVQEMHKQALISLRQGLHDYPGLLPDAHFLQALARRSHPFSFAQAVKDLRAERTDLPEDARALRRHCQVCASAFKYLLSNT